MTARIVVDETEPDVDVVTVPFEVREIKLRKDTSLYDEFQVIDFLGRGKFGEVKRCVETSSGREFAVKFIATLLPQDRRDVAHEVDMMTRLHHRRLVQLYDAFEAKREMCLVLEIVYGGELFDRVISDDFVLTERASVCFMRQICEGVEYMHSQNIIHLDLKPENILCLTKTGNRVKIIDFGLARVLDPKKDMRAMYGTPEFMAPEVVLFDPIDCSTDMWSIGVMAYVLLSGLSPFMGRDDNDTLNNVSYAKYDFASTEFQHVSQEAKNFITNLLQSDKKKRLSAAQCLASAWLKKPCSSSSSSLVHSKQRLRHLVCRRRWQKAIRVIIALIRMGADLSRRLNGAETRHILQRNCHIANVDIRGKPAKQDQNKTDILTLTVSDLRNPNYFPKTNTASTGDYQNGMKPQDPDRVLVTRKPAEPFNNDFSALNVKSMNNNAKSDDFKDRNVPRISPSSPPSEFKFKSTKESGQKVSNGLLSNSSDAPITRNAKNSVPETRAASGGWRASLGFMKTPKPTVTQPGVGTKLSTAERLQPGSSQTLNFPRWRGKPDSPAPPAKKQLENTVWALSSEKTKNKDLERVACNGDVMHPVTSLDRQMGGGMTVRDAAKARANAYATLPTPPKTTQMPSGANDFHRKEEEAAETQNRDESENLKRCRKNDSHSDAHVFNLSKMIAANKSRAPTEKPPEWCTTGLNEKRIGNGILAAVRESTQDLDDAAISGGKRSSKADGAQILGGSVGKAGVVVTPGGTGVQAAPGFSSPDPRPATQVGTGKRVLLRERITFFSKKE